jgi:LuxR family transcriptional regulator, maltose regulon positive regulatory protein
LLPNTGFVELQEAMLEIEPYLSDNSRFLTNCLVERPELVMQISSALKRKSVFLSAPAGYGKSTLLHQIASTIASWSAINLVRVEDFAGCISEALSSASQGQITTLVIDNVHEIDSAQAQCLGEAIEVGHDNLRFVISGRGPGHLRAIRLSLAGHLLQLGASNLRFLGQDASKMPTDVVDRQLVLDSCEGWPVALAISCAADMHPANDFHRLMTRYIEETLYADLDIPCQHWLETAALLDAPTARSIRAISAIEPPSFRVLDALPCELINAETQEWRLHPVFRKFLIIKLQARGEEFTRNLHRLAAKWFKEKDEPYLAASHAIESGDGPFLKSLLDEGARHFIAQGRVIEASHWIDYLDSIDDDMNVRIRLYRVTALILKKQFGEADSEHQLLIDLAREWQNDDRECNELYEELVARNRFNTILRDFIDPTRQPDARAAQALVSDFSDAPSSVSGEAMLLLGLIELDSGRLSDAEVLLRKALPKLRATQSWLALVHAVTARARIFAWRGDNKAARILCDRLIEELADAGVNNAPVMAMAKLRHADHLILSGQIDAARDVLEKLDVNRLGQLGEDELTLLWSLRLSLAGIDRNRLELTNLLEIIGELSGLEISSVMPAACAAADLACGRIAEIRTYLPLQPLKARYGWLPDAATHAQHVLQLRDIQVELANGSSAAVSSRIASFLGRTRSLGISPLLIETLITAACSALLRSDEAEANGIFAEAHALATKSDSMGAISNCPLPAVRQLLNLAASCGTTISSSLEQALRPAATAPMQGLRSEGTNKPLLTSKEQEVLVHIALGHSNQKIADLLMISLATTKWHVRNILSKLDAQSRTEALAKARTMNLVN